MPVTLRLHTIATDGLAQLSYFVGDDSAGVGAVIDPRPDCGIYLELARRHGVSITRAFETHVHADFMSGSRELKALLPDLEICVSGVGDTDYGYDCTPISDAETFVIGQTRLTARHTPGHTPEHLCFEITDRERAEDPWGVFTGDCLFVGSVGRPDLLGEKEAGSLAGQLHETLRGYVSSLADDVIVMPCHGAGSACGAGIGDRPVTTIGREKRTNPFMREASPERFKTMVLAGAPPVPAHYPRLKRVNLKPTGLGRPPVCPALDVEGFERLVEEGQTTILDTRDMLAFGGGHVAGAINIGDQPEMSPWAGDMLDPERAIALILSRDDRDEKIVVRLWRVGFTRFAGYLAGGMRAWSDSGRPLRTLGQIDVRTLRERRGELRLLDVRSDREWREGHIPDAEHLYVGTLRDRSLAAETAKRMNGTTAIYCGSGYRASIAASILQGAGAENVLNVPGSWTAWRAIGGDVEE